VHDEKEPDGSQYLNLERDTEFRFTFTVSDQGARF
jgi:hypothetical protein